MLYDLHCKNCKTTVEMNLPMSRDKNPDCENCNQELETVITGGSGFKLIGPGFYLNDYKKKESKSK